MNTLYFLLLIVAAVLLLLDSFSGSSRNNVSTRLLPLALFFWVLVPLIQVGRSL